MNLKIAIPIDDHAEDVTVRDDRLAAVILPRENNERKMTEEEIVRRALSRPFGGKALRQLARGKKKVLVITSDHTRAMPSQVTMPLLLEEIRKENPSADVTILIGTGMHRPTTRQEMAQRFGDQIVREEKIAVHNAFKKEDMAYFGLLPSGGELWLNRLVREADLVVSEGFIEPHFFAGFSGGRKSILPGVASEKTVLYNHNARFIADENARQGQIDGNPIHRDMAFAAKQAGLAFILNVLLDKEKKIAGAVAGEPQSAHAAGCRLCEQSARETPVLSEIVITSNGGFPLDQNLYQCVKGMTSAEACVKENGVIIMCGGLRDGHGGEAFCDWFRKHARAQDVAAGIRAIQPEDTKPDQWQAQILARVLERARCLFVTGEENRSLIESMHMTYMPSVQEALEKAFDLMGDRAQVTVIPDGVGVYF